MDELVILQIFLFLFTILILIVAFLLKLATGKGRRGYIVLMAALFLTSTLPLLGRFIGKEVGKVIGIIFALCAFGLLVFSGYLSKKNL